MTATHAKNKSTSLRLLTNAFWKMEDEDEERSSSGHLVRVFNEITLKEQVFWSKNSISDICLFTEAAEVHSSPKNSQ